jgi:hypothetical protein
MCRPWQSLIQLPTTGLARNNFRFARHPTTILDRTLLKVIRPTKLYRNTAAADRYSYRCDRRGGGKAQPDRTVMILGEHITEINESAKIAVPRDSQVVDATSKFLIPGLGDYARPFGAAQHLVPNLSHLAQLNSSCVSLFLCGQCALRFLPEARKCK